MESEMKNLLQELEKAINETIYESDRIAGVVAEMKRSGYDVSLLLETTIALTANRGEQQEEHAAERLLSSGEVDFTEQDQKFLEELKIAVGD